MKVLVAIDGSDYSRMAIEFVASRRTLIKFRPDVEVLHVQTPLPANPARVVGTKVVHSYYADEAEKVLKPARLRLHKAGFSPAVRYVVGRPAIEISKSADKNNADLLVLGSHGHSALAGMLLGSVTNEVLVRTKKSDADCARQGPELPGFAESRHRSRWQSIWRGSGEIRAAASGALRRQSEHFVDPCRTRIRSDRHAQSRGVSGT